MQQLRIEKKKRVEAERIRREEEERLMREKQMEEEEARIEAERLHQVRGWVGSFLFRKSAQKLIKLWINWSKVCGLVICVLFF